MKYVILGMVVFLLASMGFAYAAPPTYIMGDTEKYVDCTDPTVRDLAPGETTPRPLPKEEIERVELYMSQVDKDPNPPVKITMLGGCARTAVSLDALQGNTGTWYEWAVAFDTNGIEGAVSESFVFEYIQIMRPGPPVVTE